LLIIDASRVLDFVFEKTFSRCLHPKAASLNGDFRQEVRNQNQHLRQANAGQKEPQKRSKLMKITMFHDFHGQNNYDHDDHWHAIHSKV
jgi:hypothetical protein